jgi:hypothetical protein
MIKVRMEVNKKKGAGAQKNGAAARAEYPNELAAGVRGGEARAVGKTAEQVFNEAAGGETLVARLEADYPELRFRAGKRFMFRPPRTVVYEEFLEDRRGNGDYEEGADEAFDGGRRGLEWGLQLLHEVGHALSGHRDFRTDPERIRMEREAWERARELAERYRAAGYNIYYDEDFVEVALDTYRDWLHRRSACPECGLTRYQTVDGRWHCPGCEGF